MVARRASEGLANRVSGLGSGENAELENALLSAVGRKAFGRRERGGSSYPLSVLFLEYLWQRRASLLNLVGGGQSNGLLRTSKREFCGWRMK